MKKLLTAAVLAMTFALGGVAFADDTGAPFDARKAAAGDCARAKAKGKACQLDFKGDTIDGNGIGGGSDSVVIPVELPFNSLIKLRLNFHDLLIKSAEDI